jgi:predicted DNA-binding antitoxin AbrB/MazE fold protein
MAFDVDAIFDHGMLRPLEPIALPDGARVHLHVETSPPAPDAPAQSAKETLRQSRQDSVAEFQRLMADLPLEGATDEFTGADHDRVLYGRA